MPMLSESCLVGPEKTGRPRRDAKTKCRKEFKNQLWTGEVTFVGHAMTHKCGSYDRTRLTEIHPNSCSFFFSMINERPLLGAILAIEHIIL